ncbi:protein-L-isoaspartate O-methyltransferase family protein [Candidatus Spongiihabitans sp.]|uniref:protein-L-isoaspartate O-methyltransferase family protein n=1 Tax=Candidatus Spongiihabitans sp. TaxID=3101308 RepID=UPI003C6F9D5E
MDYEVARVNMIEQQIRPWNVLEMQTLNALSEIRREDFVPAQYKDLSFADVRIPIGGGSIGDGPISDGQVMLEPKVGARMVEALGLKPIHKILEIGTGTGYLTALLATICEHVTSVEIDQQLTRQAGMNLAMAGIINVELVQSDCFAFCHNPGEHGSQFDGVLITGSMPEIDKTFRNMINIEGCMVGIEGYNPAMQVVVYRAAGARRSLFETSVPRLMNVDDKPSFTF